LLIKLLEWRIRALLNIFNFLLLLNIIAWIYFLFFVFEHLIWRDETVLLFYWYINLIDLLCHHRTMGDIFICTFLDFTIFFNNLWHNWLWWIRFNYLINSIMLVIIMKFNIVWIWFALSHIEIMIMYIWDYRWAQYNLRHPLNLC
jgi:hypothetical protein